MSPNENEYLPIKVVIPHKEDMSAPDGGGRTKDFSKFFDYEECRENLLDDLENIAASLEPVFQTSNVPAVARVKLRKEAIAKSHKPDSLLKPRTCPIIGGENFDQLLVSVTSRGLHALRTKIHDSTAKCIKSDIAKILSIEQFSMDDALGQWSPESLSQFLTKTGMDRLKLRLFNHRDRRLNQRVEAALKEIAGNVRPLQYAQSLKLYSVPARRDHDYIASLCEFVGTQSVDVFEQFTVTSQSTIVSNITYDHLPPPVEGINYPIVGIIDSGTDPNNKLLQAWVQVRDETLCPPDDQDNTHGSLVAGIIINAKGMNHSHPGFPSSQAKVVDVVAMPSRGLVTEVDLVEAVRHAFQEHPHVQVWNLSVNSRQLCRNDAFSSFAIALDSLQDEFGTIIINSAGNFEETPAHSWPRPTLADSDRIASPADSLRGLTIGSIAHLDSPVSCSKKGEPSPFTRRGPGASFTPKPELTHIGGNTNSNLQYNQIGVLSVDGQGNLAETIGTSFAAPSVALTAAALSFAMEEPPSRHLLKAFLVHSAVLTSANNVTKENFPFLGFGTPQNVGDILRCRPWEATLVFDMDLPYHQRYFSKTHFPIPNCLIKNGKVFGEIILTLVYDPPLDAGSGAAYSQINVNPSLGICDIVDDEEKYGGIEIFPCPKDIRKAYEKEQIEYGFKWSPVKVYRREICRGLAPKEYWRITLEVHARSVETAPPFQPVAMLVTIRDPEKELPIYNEVVSMMTRQGWNTQNLQIREDIRIRTRI